MEAFQSACYICLDDTKALVKTCMLHPACVCYECLTTHRPIRTNCEYLSCKGKEYTWNVLANRNVLANMTSKKARVKTQSSSRSSGSSSSVRILIEIESDEDEDDASADEDNGGDEDDASADEDRDLTIAIRRSERGARREAAMARREEAEMKTALERSLIDGERRGGRIGAGAGAGSGAGAGEKRKRYVHDDDDEWEWEG